MSRKLRIILQAMLVFFILGACVTSAWSYEIDRRGGAYFYFIQGLLQEQEGQYQQAIESYRQALTYDSLRAPLFFQLGVAYSLSGDTDQAIRQVQEAIKRDEKYIPSYFLLGSILIRQNKVKEAVPVYEKVVSLEPENQAALFILGTLYLNISDYSRAIEILQKVCKLAPDQAEAYMSLAGAYLAVDKKKEAIDTYGQVIKLAPENVMAYFGLAESYERNQEYQKAIETYQQLIKINPGNSLAQYRRGVLYYEQKDFTKSAEAFSKIEKKVADDLSVSSYFYLAVISEEQKDLKQAVNYYELSLQRLNQMSNRQPLNQSQSGTMLPARSSIYLHLGYLFLQLKQPKKSLQVMQEAIAVDRSNVLLHYFLGVVYTDLKKYTDAIAAYKQAITVKNEQGLRLGEAQKEPEIDELYFRLGVLYDQSGDFSQMVESMQKAISYNSKNTQALNYLGYSYADRGENLPQAEGYLKKAVLLEPENGAFLDSLGWLYYHQEKYGEALEYLTKAVTYMPNDPTVLEHAGDIYAALLQTEEALRYWRQSLSANPRNPLLKKKIKEIQK
jgi:tetratricopeptide (TPR) repeat protein